MVYVGIVTAAWLLQRRLMYFPDPSRVAPAAVGLPEVEELEIATADGNTLVTWFAEPADGMPAILYFTGNGGSLAWRAGRIRRLLNTGYGGLFVNYRGYGGSGGSPSERALVADGMLAFDTLVGRGARPGEIVLYGESLGAAVAVQVALERRPAALVLEAPFATAVDLAASVYPLLPVRLLMKDRFETIAVIGRVAAPILMIHGTLDSVVPPAPRQRRVEAAADPKLRIEVPGAGHNDLERGDVAAKVDRFIAQWVIRPGGGPPGQPETPNP